MASALRRLAPVSICFALALAILLLTHYPSLTLPYFWDEMGQFVPAALDIHDHGWFVPRSTLPNVHPPALMTVLAGVWSLFGYSIPCTRVTMLLIAALGVSTAYALARRLVPGRHSVWVPVLLLASPWFWSQSIMAQLDMPAMVLATATFVAFLAGRDWLAVILATGLVLTKETGLVVPLVLAVMTRRRRFLLPAIALVLWATALKSATGSWTGNREFADYNLFYPLHPVRLGAATFRRLYQLFVGSFHWIGTAGLVLAISRRGVFSSREWHAAWALLGTQVLLVTALGGAVLERYLLPVLPILYCAFATAMARLEVPWRILMPATLSVGLAASIFINPPYPFPFENNLAWTDFVELQRSGALEIERRFPGRVVATAWPLTDALRDPRFGFVSQRIRTAELHGFERSRVLAAPAPELFVLYCRMWDPHWSLMKVPWVTGFVSQFYGYERPVAGDELLAQFGLVRVFRMERRGQWIEIYSRPDTVGTPGW